MNRNHNKQNKLMNDRPIRRNIRFPDDEEIEEFLEDAIPLAERNAAKHNMELEPWMLTEDVCTICVELEKCDQGMLEAAVERVYEKCKKTEACIGTE